MRRSHSRTSLRRSRSSHHTRQLSPSQRRRPLVPEKRAIMFSSSKIRSSDRSPKRARLSPVNRNKSPPRRLPRERRQFFSDTKHISPIKQNSSSWQISVRDLGSKRFSVEEKLEVGKPFYRGPEKNILIERDSLKKIVVNVESVPAGIDNIKRDIVDPEDVRVVRHTGEGSRSIFDREEIIKSRRKIEEYESQRSRRLSPSPINSGGKRSPEERFVHRRIPDRDRIPRGREYGRGRDDGHRSSRRIRSDRRERYDDSERRRSRRGRSDGRLSRRSPGSPRRRSGSYAEEDYPPDGPEYEEDEVEEQFIPHPELPNRSGDLYPGVEYIAPENVIPFIRPSFHPVPVRLPGIRHRLPASVAVGRPLPRPGLRVRPAVVPVRPPPRPFGPPLVMLRPGPPVVAVRPPVVLHPRATVIRRVRHPIYVGHFGGV